MPDVNQTYVPKTRFGINEHVIAIAWSSTEAKLAAVGAEGGVYYIDLDTPDTEPLQIANHAGGALALAWAPNTQLLASSGQDGKVRLFNKDGSAHSVLELNENWVGQVCFSPDGHRLAASGRKVRLWHSADGSLLHDFPANTGTVEALCFSPDGRSLAAVGYGGVRLLTPFAPYSERQLQWSGVCLAATWRPKSDVIAVGGQNATVQFWRLPKGHRAQIDGLEFKVRALAWNRSGRFLATGGSTVITLWDFKRGPEGCVPQQLLGHFDQVQGMVWQHRGDVLASIAADAHLLLWRPSSSSKFFAEFELISIPTVVAFSADDRFIAVGGDGGEITIFELIDTPVKTAM